MKIAFDLLRIEMGSYKKREQSPVFFFSTVVNIKVTQQFYDTCYFQCNICVH